MKRGSSIFRTFLIPFILTVLLAGGIIGYLGNRNSKILTEQLFDSLIRDIDGKTRQEIEFFMSTPIVSGKRTIGHLQILGGDLESAKDHLFIDFIQEIKSSNAVVSIEYANEENETFGVVKGVFDLEYGYTRSGKETNYTYQLFDALPSINFEKEKPVWELPNYDVREREWYKQGFAGETQQWTPVYGWPNGDVGLDSIIPVYRDGRKVGVIDTSVTLGTIRTFLLKHVSSQVKEIYILEKDGYVVAGTDIERPAIVNEDQTIVRVSAKKSESTLLNAIYSAIEARGGLVSVSKQDSGEIVHEGKSVVYSVAAYEDEYGLEWYIVSAIDKTAVIGSVTNTNRVTILIVTFLLLAAVVIAYAISREVTKPIIKLAQSVLTFSEVGKELANLPKNQRGEVGTLVNSIDKMMKKIRSQFSELKDKELQLGIENEKLELILGSIGEIVILVDAQGKILYQNLHAVALTGKATSAIVGKELDKVIPNVITKSKGNAFEFVSNAFKTRQIQSSVEPLTITDSLGVNRLYVATAAPMAQENNKLTGVVVIMRDITEERQLEEAKTDIVALASHQLRTPLSAAKWYTELLSTDLKGLSKTQRENLDRIKSAVDRMIVQVNVLLNATQVELGLTNIEISTILSEDFIYSILELFEHERREKELNITIDIAKTATQFDGDKRIISTILQNVISNAVKYSKEKGSVRVTVTKKNKYVTFSVKDTGIGISDAEKKRIFTRLFRGDNAVKHDPNGNGVGLYIAQSLARNLGGDITFTSKLGRGSTFTVVLPVTA